MELNERDINFQTEVYRLFGENQILLHKNKNLTKERDQYKHQGNLLREDIALLKKNQKTRDKLIDNLKEENANLNNELDQYKTAHNKLTAELKEAVAESIKYKRERDSLIKDVEKLRKEKEDLKRLGYETYKDAVKFKTLTEHIKDKALNNPSEHRYFRLVHFIDDLEADTHD